MLRIRTASTSTCSVAFLCILFIYSIMHVCSTVSLCRCQHSKQYPYVHVRTLYPVLLLREVSVGSDLHEGSKKRMAGGDPMRRGACNVDLCARSATVQNSVLPSTLQFGHWSKVNQRTGVDSAEAAAKHAHLQLAVASANATFWPCHVATFAVSGSKRN